jgi:flagellar export protein FliJ
MPSSTRLERLRRLHGQRREQAAAELAARAARLATVERELASTRAAEDDARAGATVREEAGTALVLAWAYADALARRAMGLLDDRARAVTSAECARETVYDRRREEEQLARLAARVVAREDARATRARDRTLDELALWSHGRKA